MQVHTARGITETKNNNFNSHRINKKQEWRHLYLKQTERKMVVYSLQNTPPLPKHTHPKQNTSTHLSWTVLSNCSKPARSLSQSANQSFQVSQSHCVHTGVSQPAASCCPVQRRKGLFSRCWSQREVASVCKGRTGEGQSTSHTLLPTKKGRRKEGPFQLMLKPERGGLCVCHLDREAEEDQHPTEPFNLHSAIFFTDFSAVCSFQCGPSSLCKTHPSVK